MVLSLQPVKATTLSPEEFCGPSVRIWPYARGCFPRNFLYVLWSYFEEDRASEFVFHSQIIDGNTPVNQRGDLAEFVTYFCPPAPIVRLLLIAQERSTGEIAGCFWFDDVVPGHRAAASVFMRKKFRQSCAVEAGKLAMHYAFTVWHLTRIWAMSPWRYAATFAERVGFSPCARFPDFVQVGDKRKDLYVLSLTREQFYAK